MKRVLVLLIAAAFIVALAGCSREATVKKTYEEGFKTYYEMSDGTWQCDGYSYKYRLQISGRMPNAPIDSTCVYLSNIEDIPFERAYLAAGLSSSMADYFDPEEAVFIGWLFDDAES